LRERETDGALPHYKRVTVGLLWGTDMGCPSRGTLTLACANHHCFVVGMQSIGKVSKTDNCLNLIAQNASR